MKNTTVVGGDGAEEMIRRFRGKIKKGKGKRGENCIKTS